MNKKNISKRGVALLAAVLVFVASLILLQATLTSGFKVETRSVNLYTDEGVNLSATLFVPQNATAATPAAGIVAAPGGNTPHTFMPAIASSFPAAATWCWPMTITAPAARIFQTTAVRARWRP